MRLPSGETLGAPTALSLSCISGSHVCAMAAEAKRTTRVRAVATYFMIFLLIWITDGALSFYSRLSGKSTNLGRNSSLQNSGWNSAHSTCYFAIARAGLKSEVSLMSRLLLGTVCGLVYGALSAASMLPLTFADKPAA